MKAQNQQRSSKHRLPTRLTLILIGAFWFIWIGIEDQGTTLVLLLAASLVLALVTATADRVFQRLPRTVIRRYAYFWLIGVIGGTLVTPMAILLMAVKIALHNHAIPDFSPGDVIQVLNTTPVWVLGALMLSTAAVLYDRLHSM